MKKLLSFLLLLTAAGAFAGDPSFDDFGNAVPSLQLRRDALTAGDEGLRAGDAKLRVLYPQQHDDPFVVEGGGQRIVLRALASRAAKVADDGGRARYAGAYDGVDAIHLPGFNRSEELLLLRGPGSQRVFEYELAETEGVSSIALDQGRVVFRPLKGQSEHLVIERPWVLDAEGKPVENGAKYELTAGGRHLRLIVDPGTAAFPLLVDPTFTLYTSSVPERERHTATLLNDGRVLVTGGQRWVSDQVNPTLYADAWLYDPSANSWTQTGSMAQARSDHQATLLADGRVMITGGGSTVEFYNPATGQFSIGGPLLVARSGHTATRIPDGRVAIYGGTQPELYNPSTGTSVLVGPTRTAQAAIRDHTATLMPDGRIAIVGGRIANLHVLGGVLLWDPIAQTATVVSDPQTHTDHDATLMANGALFVTAGTGDFGTFQPPPTDQIFFGTGPQPPAAGTRPSQYDSATLLADGRVLVIRGRFEFQAITGSSLLYDPVNNQYSDAGLNVKRIGHSATRLQNGNVLIAFGRAGCGGNPCPSGSPDVSSYEIFDVGGGTTVIPTIIPSANPSPYGSLKFTVSIAPATSGYVTLYYDGIAFAGPITYNGTSSLTIDGAAVPIGTHNITAVYSGNGSFNGGTSATLVQTVTAADRDHRPDVDGTGKSDIFWFSPEAPGGELWQSTWSGGPTFTYTRTGNYDFGSSRATRPAGFGDFNRDSKTDYVWFNRDTLQVELWLMNGNQIATRLFNIGTMPDKFWRVAGVGDFDGDGDSDLVLQSDRTGEVRVWIMNGTTVQSNVFVLTVDDKDWKIAAVADFNRDAKDDLLWQNIAHGSLVIWTMQGAVPSNTYSLIPPDSGDWRIAGAADFNGDHKTDVLWQNVVSGQLVVWTMNDTAVDTSFFVNYGANPKYRAEGTGDFDGDGDNDILLYDDVALRGVIVEMNAADLTTPIGLAVSTDAFVDTAHRMAQGVGPNIDGGYYPQPRYGYDISVDGKADVYWADPATGNAERWLMNGTSTPTRLTLGNIGAGNTIGAVEDFDLDGRADFVVSSGGAATFYLASDAGIRTTVPVAISSPIRGSADFDGDGYMDVVSLSGTTLTVTLLRRTAIKAQGSFTLDNANWVVAATLESPLVSNGAAVLLENLVDRRVVLWWFRGTSLTSTDALITLESTDWRVGGLANFDADTNGNPDILWENLSSGQVAIWFMNGSVVKSALTLYTVETPLWRVQTLGDFDGDGHTDILWRHAGNGNVAAWFMTNSTIREGWLAPFAVTPTTRAGGMSQSMP